VNDFSDSPDGVLLINKPRGLTSHDVVDRVRKVSGIRKVGHIGTLDPMAEGLLVVCLGGATRAVQFLMGFPKEYLGVIKFGAISSTYDGEGEIVLQEKPLPKATEWIEREMKTQVGWRMQLPPPYSAIKIRGKKLYEYARRGEEVPQQPRRVYIRRFELLDYCEPELRFRADVGSGTYIRSMAHDLGIQLGCGAYLSMLRRTSVGHFSLKDAVDLPTLIEHPAVLGEKILSLNEALSHMPRITVSGSGERAVLHGRGFSASEILVCESLPQPSENSLVLNEQGNVLSVVRGELLEEQSESADEQFVDEVEEDIRRLYFRPVRVFARPVSSKP